MFLTLEPTTDIRGNVLAMVANKLSLSARDRVLANMVIGSNGATSLHEDSAPLSPPADRTRFHQIRSLASGIVVGGRTYQREHYEKVPLPVFVATRDPDLLSRDDGPNTHSLFFHLSPVEVLRIAAEREKGPILIEGGINVLLPLLKLQRVDRLFLTRSPIAGDNHFFDFNTLHHNYELSESETVENVSFEQWRPRKLQS